MFCTIFIRVDGYLRSVTPGFIRYRMSAVDYWAKNITDGLVRVTRATRETMTAASTTAGVTFIAVMGNTAVEAASKKANPGVLTQPHPSP